MYRSDPRAEPPRVSSRLKWRDVSLPAELTTAQLDDLIFSELQLRSRKTAMIIACVGKTLKERSISIDYEIIGARIRELAERKKIRSFGNVAMWRHSEVCLRERHRRH